MTSEQRKAHARMLSSLPVRTHIHVEPPRERSETVQRVSKDMKEEMARLNEGGMIQERIAEIMGLSPTTVSRHLNGKV